MEERISEKTFEEQVKDLRKQAGVEEKVFADAEMLEELYAFIERYAKEKNLLYTAVALSLVQSVLSIAAETMADKHNAPERYQVYFQHSLSICRMLIDLHIPLKKEEEDIILAAAICHVLPENRTEVNFENLDEKLTGKYHLDPAITEIIKLITREDGMTEEEQKLFYERIKRNKLALLVRLADRGNLVERLHGLSSWSAREYISETRKYFFPLCIYAKEYYPELTGPVSIMMEKMRCHIEASEILLNRYETREMELTKEILALKEENARIRSTIRKMRSEQMD